MTPEERRLRQQRIESYVLDRAYVAAQSTVSEAIAQQYVTEEWPLKRIKRAHDAHIHVRDGSTFVCTGCPVCSYCRCPIPLIDHVQDSYYGPVEQLHD